MKFCFKALRRFVVKHSCIIILTVIVLNISAYYFLQAQSLVLWSDSSKRYNKKFILKFSQDKFETLKTEAFGLRYSNNINGTQKVQITVAEFWEGYKTGNPLIDDYGKNNIYVTGEMGRGVILTADVKTNESAAMSEYNINTIVSDLIPLNRMVLDSRLYGCEKLQYKSSLPTASVIVPFYNEWSSVLLRTVYSIINRSPRQLLREIILIDDASTLDTLKDPLKEYIDNNFPEGLVRLVRLPERRGLIYARMSGSREATGDVLIFFDSHMEVNIDWLRPLLTEIASDSKTVAMATLDYIQAATFEYKYNENYLTRYGWDWRLEFFETFFRNDQVGPQPQSPRPGATMVGAAFAIDRKYFHELGGYDEGMQVWGGENLEMSWRVWLCGGRLMHVPCSRIGHIPRFQPYTFPGGRSLVEHFNFKRAISVWMGNYSRFVYHFYQDMKTLDVGDISSRLEIKSRLQCKDFSWYLQNVWPELNVPDENMSVWGEVVNEATGLCLDNNNYLFQYLEKLFLSPCSKNLPKQAFSLTTDSLLRTSLQCVVVPNGYEGAQVKLEDCIIGSKDRWKYLQDHSLVHLKSSLCLDVGEAGPTLQKCHSLLKSQKWLFRPYYFI